MQVTLQRGGGIHTVRGRGSGMAGDDNRCSGGGGQGVVFQNRSERHSDQRKPCDELAVVAKLTENDSQFLDSEGEGEGRHGSGLVGQRAEH